MSDSQDKTTSLEEFVHVRYEPGDWAEIMGSVPAGAAEKMVSAWLRTLDDEVNDAAA